MNNKMIAAMFYGLNKPIVIEEVEIPKPGRDEVLVDVKACGVCGSDIHIVFENADVGFLPIILGHEPAGVIAEVGPNVDEFKKGDRVAVSTLIPCGKCINCLAGRESICLYKKLLGIQLNGGLAEYMVVPINNIIKLPDSMPFEHGALVTDAVATPYHALVKRGKLKIGEKVAIFGCGGLGFHAVQIAKICGASQIIAVDVNNVALERAKKVGATDTVNPAEEDSVNAIMNLTDQIGVDLVLEVIGLQKTIAQGAQCLKRGGRLVVVGLGADDICVLPPNIFVRSELSVLGSSAWDRSDIIDIISLVQRKRLDLSGSISGRYKLDDINVALEHLKTKKDNPIRLVIVQD